MYFFAVPAVSMILLIYILGSLHILRWGTREKRSDYVLDDDKLSLLDRYSLHFIINFHSNLEIYNKSTKAFNIRVFFPDVVVDREMKEVNIVLILFLPVLINIKKLK